MNFTESLSFDKQLWHYDLIGSQAHVRGLVRSSLLTEEEGEELVRAIEEVREEFSTSTFVFGPSDEDIHSAIERRLTELVGDLGAKLHTGRSRNDQVATDMRLYVKHEIFCVGQRLLELQAVLGDIAETSKDVYLPGYTHLQRAQPVLLAHHFLAHGWALARDFDRLYTSFHRGDVSPLGAGALGGSTLPLDPDYTAHELGFHARFQNSLDAVSDRDFVVEFLFNIALLGVHLSRIGEEAVLWSTEEFGFMRLDDGYSTGSSMLPHKKNPDIAELARGKTGRFIGNLTGLLTTLKGLPLSYNRDLQEDKEALFDSVHQMKLALTAVSGMLSSAYFDFGSMRSAGDSEYLRAIDLAEYLVRQGIPFRKAHSIIGAMVRESMERRVPLSELVLSHPQLGESAVVYLEPSGALNRRATAGGSGIEAVALQLEEFKLRMELDGKRLDEMR